MLRKSGLSLGILVVGVLVIAGCEDKPAPPAAPTPPVVTTPPPAPTPPPPPPEPAALDSLAIDPPSVRSQGSPTGKVTLTAPAPAGGAVVVLSSGNPDIAKVPSGMTVQAGEMTGTFGIDAATVSAVSPVTITATYLGVTKTAVVTVQPPPLDARYTVMSASMGADACAIIDVAGSVDCTFDASSSDGFVARYLWVLKVGSNEFNVSTTSPMLLPATTCAFVGGGTIGSNGTVPMSVSLQVEDRSGTKSSANQKTIPLTPNGRCGY